MDRPSGQVIRRYERARTGELVHIDIKKLGKIADGGGWKVLGRQAGTKNNGGHGPRRVGYGFIHSAVAFEPFLHLYNHHRSHTALGGKPPISRVDNLPGDYN
jgi:hypothetical protein